MSKDHVEWNVNKREWIDIDDHPKGIQITIYPAFDKSSEIVVPVDRVDALIAQIQKANDRGAKIWRVMRSASAQPRPTEEGSDG